MSSKFKPHEMRNLVPAKETPVYRFKTESKKESLQIAIAARRAELQGKKPKGHAAVWFMCILSILFLSFGYGYEIGVDRKNNPLPPMKVKCEKIIVKEG